MQESNNKKPIDHFKSNKAMQKILDQRSQEIDSIIAKHIDKALSDLGVEINAKNVGIINSVIDNVEKYDKH